MNLKKGTILILFTMLFLLPIVTAEYNREASYAWLQNKSQASLTIEELSYATLALNNGQKNVNTLVQRLQEQKDATQACWPNNGCTIKDTALAYLVLKKTGQITQAVEEYLAQPNVLIPGVTSGEWRIQIESPSNGTCILKWNGGANTKEFQILGNKINPTAQQYFINIAQDLDANLINAQTNAKVEVDCSQLSGSIIISLMYKKGNNIYILQNVQSPRAMETNALAIENGCYGLTAGATTCDYETTLTATWAQVEAGKNIDGIGTQTYLESSLTNNELHRGILARTLAASNTVKTVYFNQMQTSQLQDGSWSAGDVLTTAFNVFALQGATGYTDTTSLALGFLDRVAANDGSWNQDILDTSITIMAIEGGRLTDTFIDTTITTESKETICDDNMDNDDDGYYDCGDGDCDTFFACDHCNNGMIDSDEEDVDCGGITCMSCEQTATQETICYDGVDNDNDSYTDCEDFDCESEESCIEEVEFTPTETEEKSTLWMWIVFMIIVVLGGAGFFYLKYIKTGKINFGDIKGPFKKKSKPNFEQYVRQQEYKPQQPQRPIQQPRQQPKQKSKEDDELEKSLREAEKLLKGE